MDEGIKHFYVNSTAVFLSVYDVLLKFQTQGPAEKTDVAQESGIEVIDRFDVRMSPQHAKALAALLAKNVLEYEKMFSIQLPITPETEPYWKEFTSNR